MPDGYFDRRFYVCTLCGRELQHSMLHSVSFSLGCMQVTHVCPCTPGWFGVITHNYRMDRDCVRELYKGHPLQVPYEAPFKRRLIEPDDLMVRDFARALGAVETVPDLLGTNGT